MYAYFIDISHKVV